MAPASFRYLFAAALLLLGAALGPFAEAKFAGVNPFCIHATYRQTCTDMVKGATTLDSAMFNALQSALAEAKRVKAMIPTVLPAISQLSSKIKNEVVQTCTEDFDGTISDIEETIAALKAKDMGTAQSHLSAALRRDCRDAIHEFGLNSELSKYATQLTRTVDNAMAVVTQRPASR
ncbi:hypothetical protein Salat_1968200 [Sesamum alatum]|uniref:Pectinesterase inhibitor domain-containing protein n=1 Tax=Sesamum alatum TaxID=300844 RepID=A0AAE1Y675_9LAMI|nr:hypothetical protein Salat_1968200 [Sesamum alatum]